MLWLVLPLLVTICISSIVSAQAPTDVVARIDGRAITLADVDETIVPQVLPIQQQLYALRKTALENLIIAGLLKSEATKRHLSVDELRQQLTEGSVHVTADQVDELYRENEGAFAAMSPDEALERLRLDLESQARMQNYRKAVAELRTDVRIEINFEEPRVPVTDDNRSPSLGPLSAPVTIFEFSDFQCPYCRAAQTVLKQILADFAKDVRVVFKQSPLDIHDRAFASARASICAGDQSQFWPFHDQLFRSADLSEQTLDKLALDAGLDFEKFKACIISDESRAAVMKDLREGKKLGINATPSFIVNGRLVKGSLSYASFKEIIEREITSARKKTRVTETLK